MGGTLFPRILSNNCIKALSIDKRVQHQADERRESGYSYNGYTTGQLLEELSIKAGSDNIKKLRNFDGSIQQFCESLEAEKRPRFDWIFIDAEHTNIASFDDFFSSLSLLSCDGVIALHDSWMLYSAISNIKTYLESQGIQHYFAHVNGDVTAFFIGKLSDCAVKQKDLFLDIDLAHFVELSKQKLWSFQREIIKGEHNKLQESIYKPGDRQKKLGSPWFVPGSSMTEEQRRTMPTQVASRTPDALLRLFARLNNNQPFPVIDINDLCLSFGQLKAAKSLEFLLGECGSDKSKLHSYHILYGAIIELVSRSPRILEIGLGTKDQSIASNMNFCADSCPGGSLRAFKKYSPHAIVDGADIDRSIVVEDCRVFCVDQTMPHTFDSILVNGESCYDLIIDDGLHSPDANLYTLDFALSLLAPNGFIVIEDISSHALDIWKVVGYQMQEKGFRCSLIKDNASYLFVVSRRMDFPRLN